MRKKQVIAMVLSAVLAAGSNMTAVTTLAAVCDPQAAGGSPVRSAGAGRDVLWSSAEGDEEDSGDSIDLEKAVTEAVSQVSGGASKEETVYIFTDEYGNQRDITVSNWLKKAMRPMTGTGKRSPGMPAERIFIIRVRRPSSLLFRKRSPTIWTAGRSPQRTWQARAERSGSASNIPIMFLIKMSTCLSRLCPAWPFPMTRRPISMLTTVR